MTDDDPLLSIGELSRASGLTVSALRFYDRARVLTPTCVDGWSGYRRYAPEQVLEARMLAGMRRVQVPVAEMAAALEALRAGDRTAVHDLLEGHLRRLEEGLADARRELGRLRGVLDDLHRPAPATTGPLRRSVPAASLLSLLGAVRHAVGTDPELPVLMGVLVEIGHGVTLVATDRYRMVVAGPWQHDGAEPVVTSAVLPTPEVDRLVRWLDGRPDEVELSVRDDGLVVRAAGTGEELRLQVLDAPYPDYRRVLEPGTGGEPVDAESIERALRADDRLVEVDGLTVDRTFLWDAVRSVPDRQVLLPADGVIAPLVVRSPDEDLLALVMPVAGRAR